MSTATTLRAVRHRRVAHPLEYAAAFVGGTGLTGLGLGPPYWAVVGLLAAHRIVRRRPRSGWELPVAVGCAVAAVLVGIGLPLNHTLHMAALITALVAGLPARRQRGRRREEEPAQAM